MAAFYSKMNSRNKETEFVIGIFVSDQDASKIKVNSNRLVNPDDVKENIHTWLLDGNTWWCVHIVKRFWGKKL